MFKHHSTNALGFKWGPHGAEFWMGGPWPRPPGPPLEPPLARRIRFCHKMRPLWYLDNSDYRRLNVTWKQFFSPSIFNRCRRENVSCFLFHCQCQSLLTPYVLGQRQILFWKKALCSGNVVALMLAAINKCKIDMILSKFHSVSMHCSISGSYSIICGNWSLMPRI